jgi:hypothetical protein
MIVNTLNGNARETAPACPRSDRKDRVNGFLEYLFSILNTLWICGGKLTLLALLMLSAWVTSAKKSFSSLARKGYYDLRRMHYLQWVLGFFTPLHKLLDNCISRFDTDPVSMLSGAVSRAAEETRILIEKVQDAGFFYGYSA